MILIELEDTDWFPDALRDQQLGYIGWLVGTLDLYRPIFSLLPQWIKESDRYHIQDLCSGSGEPMISLARGFHQGTDVTFSDKFPPASSNRSEPFTYIKTSVDVLDLKFDTDTYYTMFNAFHHFSDIEQVAIVKRLVDSNIPFCFAEILEPNLFTFLKVIFANTLGQLLLAPFVKPFSLKRLFLTYIVPLNLVTTTYDGVVSVIKSKTKSQYQTLLRGALSKKYKLMVDSYRAPFFNRIIVIHGHPIHSTQA